jgi:hypothetical protein
VARAPVKAKLALVDTVADPVKAHANRFGAALFDGVVDYMPAAQELSTWMGVVVWGQPSLLRFLGIKEACADFSLGG